MTFHLLTHLTKCFFAVLFHIFLVSCSSTNRAKVVNLPFKKEIKFTVTQGQFGKLTHNEKGNEYSWDFAVPFGTEVLAVEAGEVVSVWEPNKGGGCSKDYSEYAHNIKVRHPDGTVAQYVHVQSIVRPGDTVRTAGLIGHTAKNGFICEPHLHFGVYRSEKHLYHSSSRETLPLYFSGLPQGKATEGESYTVK